MTSSTPGPELCPSGPETTPPPEIKPLPAGALEVITTHINADFDAMASMLAASKLYPQAVGVFPGSQEKSLRNFFLESTVYLFNFAKVRQVDFEKVKRLIMVDTRQKSRIGKLEKVLENKDLEIHIYDHHPPAPDDLPGQVEVVAPVGATVTLMTEILAGQGIGISPEEATVLIMGLFEDTGSFSFRSTTPRDFQAAAYLLAQGANLHVAAEMISRELTAVQVGLLNDLITSAQTHTINGLEVVLTHATADQYVDDLAVLVHKMMDMENIDVLFALARMEERIYLVARSRVPEVNVGEIAAELGGGGHPSAAAATIKDMTLAQAEDKLLSVLHTALGPVPTARDVMAFPVISIPPSGTLAGARELLIRYDINVLLVREEDGPILGFISRQNVAKALYHGLDDLPVSEFMTSEFGTVGPEATFAEIQHLIGEQKQRILPVVEDNHPLGVITRTDLLNILTSQTQVPASLIEEGADTRSGRTKNVSNIMRERLPREVVELLAEFGRTGDELEYAAYAVGGFIRDIFLGQENLDVDVVIEGDGIAFAQAFAAKHPEVKLRYHRKFNTAVLIWPDGFKVDVATARLEYYESPGALPTVEEGSVRMDLYRRDFTINTLAVRLNEKYFGTLIDYFRGLKDIKDGFIRVLHNLSFIEDPTRVFRAVRFEQRFGFKTGKLTVTLIQNAVRHDFFQKISGQRLWSEIKLILQEDDPAAVVRRLAEFDLLKFIHPDLDFGRNRQHFFARIKKVLAWFDLTYLGEEYEPWRIYFLALLDGLNAEGLARVSRRLNLPKRDRVLVLEGKPQGDRVLRRLYRKRALAASYIYDLLHPLETEVLLYLMAKTTRETTRRAVSTYFTQLKNVRPVLTGKDLAAMGLPPGPQFRQILQALLHARLDGEVKNKAEEKKFVRRHYLAAAGAETRGQEAS